eukprot:4410190-Pyramimonas_sp.AAC.1
MRGRVAAVSASGVAWAAAGPRMGHGGSRLRPDADEFVPIRGETHAEASGAAVARAAVPDNHSWGYAECSNNNSTWP